MPCYSPLTAYKPINSVAVSKKLVFNPREGYIDQPVKLPCGQCVGCRLERSRQWAIRCVHESSLHLNNSFITLTYDNLNLPLNNSISVREHQLFVKRLRKLTKALFTYYMCGEYGSLTGRPHYHYLLFGYDPPDKVFLTKRENITLYTSDLISKAWTYGLISVGAVTFESAAYVSRYILKKQTGKNADLHYNDYDLETGELLVSLYPEFNKMSLKNPIGKRWFSKFQTDVYPADEVVLRGIKMKPPKYYDKLYQIGDNDAFLKLKQKRVVESLKHAANNTSDRLEVRHVCQLKKLELLPRNLE